MTEGEKIQEILKGLPSNKRLFRINSGTGFVGEVVRRSSEILILKNPRPLKAAPKGWPDLCGWETVTITPEMVGEKIAIFVGEEVKVTGQLRPEQAALGKCIERMGGIFRVIR